MVIKSDLLDIGEEPYRFVILALQSLLSFSLGLSWVSYAAISIEMIYYFDISNFYNDMLTNIFAVVYVFFNIPGCYLIQNMSIYTCTCLNSILIILGNLIRLLSSNSLIYALIGQIIIALAQVLIFNINSKIVFMWFRSELRLLATCVTYVMSNLGIVLAFYIPTITFSGENKIPKDDWLIKFDYYIKIPCVIALIVGFLSILLMKDKPYRHPSASAYFKNNLENEVVLIENNKRLGIIEITKEMIKNNNFLYLVIYFTVHISFFALFNTINNMLLNHFNWKEHESNKMNSLLNIGGIIGVISLGVIGLNNKKFKFLLIIFNSGLIMSYGLVFIFILFNLDNIKWNFIYSICFLLIGAFNAAGWLLPLEFAAEVVYPLDESISTGLLFSTSQAFTIVFLIIINVLLETGNHILIFMFFIVLFIISGYASIGVQEDLRKRKLDESYLIVTKENK